MAFITGIPIRNSIHTEESTDIGVWKKYRAELTGLYTTGDGTGAMYEQYTSQDFREYNKKINDLGLSGRLFLEPMDDGFRFTNNPVLGAYTGSAAAFSLRGLSFGGPVCRVRRQEMPWISSIDLFLNFVFEADVRLNKDGEIGFDSPVENYSQLGDWMCDFTGLGDIAVEYRESTVKTNKLGDKSTLTVPNDGNFVDQAYQFKTVDCTFEELSTFLPDVVRRNPWSGVNRHSQYFASCRDGTLFEDLPTGYGVMTPYWPPVQPDDFPANGSNTGAKLYKGNRVLYGGDISGMALGVALVEGSGLQNFGLPLSFQWASNGDNRTNNPLQVGNFVSKKGGMFTPTSRITTNSGYFTVAVDQKMRWVLDARFKPDGTLGDFIGGSSAYITTWYDQSSTGSARNNLTQATASKQPKLIHSGAFVTDTEGNKSVEFNTSFLAFDTGFTSSLSTSGLSSFTLFQASGTGTNQMVASLGSYVDSNKRWYAPYIFNGEFSMNYANTAAHATTANTNLNLISMTADSTQGSMRAYLNGSQVGGNGTLANISGGTAVNGLGGLSDSLYFTGKISEFIVFENQTTSAHRDKIEEDINNHYSIY